MNGLNIISGAMGAGSLGGGSSSLLASIENLTFTQLGIAGAILIVLIPVAIALYLAFAPKKQTIANTPLDVEVKKRTEFVQKPVCDAHRDALEERVRKLELWQSALISEINGRFNELDSKRSVDVGNLHKRINDTTKGLDDKLTAMPAQIVSLLLSTKKLSKL